MNVVRRMVIIRVQSHLYKEIKSYLDIDATMKTFVAWQLANTHVRRSGAKWVR